MIRITGISLVGLALLACSARGKTTNLGEYGPFLTIKALSGNLDGSAWGFEAKKADGKWYLIINGKEWGPYGYAYDDPQFSSDGSAWGFCAEKANGKWYVLINGKKWGPYEYAGYPQFSSDGSAWGFWAKKADGKHYVLINGKEWGPYEFVGDPQFSSDGSAVFYAATGTKPSYYRIERIAVPGK